MLHLHQSPDWPLWVRGLHLLVSPAAGIVVESLLPGRGVLAGERRKKGLSLFAYGGRARRHYDDVVEGPSPASAGGRPLSPPHSGQVGGWYVGIVPTQLHYTGEMMEMRPPSPTHPGEQQAPNAKRPSHPQLLLAATALLPEYLFPIFASQAPKIHDKRNPPTLLHYPSP